MKECPHLHFVLLDNTPLRLRCRFCHLTLREDELEQGYCPECFETSGKKRDAFDEILSPGEVTRLYRCENCGVMLKPYNA